MSLERKNYNAELIREKLKNNYLDILESLGLPYLKNCNSCPLCKGLNTFKILDEDHGKFHCSNCDFNDDGIMLVKSYYSLSFHEALDLIGRTLRLRPREVSL